MTQEIQTGFRALDELIEGSKKISGIGRQQYINAIESGIPAAQREARRQLARSFAMSGVKSKTGELLRAIKGSILRFKTGTSGGYLEISMPSGKSQKFYKRANSINYGRVNSQDFDVSEEKLIRSIGGGTTTQQYRTVGKRARQSLKKTVQKGRPVKRGQKIGSLLQVESESRKTTSGSTIVETNLGTATVTKAYNYYKLNRGQLANVRLKLYEGIEEYLGTTINKLFG